MFTGFPLDRRAHAILICRLLADRADNPNFPLRKIGEIARELAEQLLDESAEEEFNAPARRQLRVIDGGRPGVESGT